MSNKFSHSYEYLEKYKDLKDGFYSYYIHGEYHNIMTRFSDGSGWMRVVEVDWNSVDHIDDDAVHDVKLSDADINFLLTDNFEYSILAEVDRMKWPYNEYATWPLRMYVHNSIVEFSSVSKVIDIRGANLVSLDENQKPIECLTNSDEIGFGTSIGDTLVSYGATNKNGFVQSFCGAGKGAVYVR